MSKDLVALIMRVIIIEGSWMLSTEILFSNADRADRGAAALVDAV